MQSKSLTAFVLLSLVFFVSASPTGNVPGKDVHNVHGTSEAPGLHRRVSDDYIRDIPAAHPHGPPHVRKARGYPEPIPASPGHDAHTDHVPRESNNHGQNGGDGYNPHPPKVPASQAAGNQRRSPDHPGPESQISPSSHQPNGPSNPHKRSDENNLGHPAGQKQNGPPSPRNRSGEADSSDVHEHGKREPHINKVRGQPLTPNHGGKGGHEGPHQRSTPNGDAGSHHGHGSPVNDGHSPAYHARDVSDWRARAIRAGPRIKYLLEGM